MPEELISQSIIECSNNILISRTVVRTGFIALINIKYTPNSNSAVIPTGVTRTIALGDVCGVPFLGLIFLNTPSVFVTYQYDKKK